MDGVHTRTLERALETLGNEKRRLASALEISMPELESYLAGKKPLPPAALIAVLDIVATNGAKHQNGR